MKSNFKYIVAGFIICLSLIFIWQLFWLKDLYSSIKLDTERSILESMSSANMDELQFRIDSMDQSPKQGKTITIKQSIGDADSKGEDKATISKEYINDGDTVSSSRPTEDDGFEIRAMENLVGLIREALHQSLDTIAPINFHIIDSSLISNFTEKKIYLKLKKIEIINLNNDSVYQSFTCDSLFNAKVQTFDYKYDSDNNMVYRIHTESLTKTILMQMAGILGTTLLIIVILGFAFWYLIQTVIQQKTLEEMKDDFTNNMTHELKTPIAVAYSAADALLNFKQGEDKEKRDRYLAICKDQLEELSGLVEQILSMSMERRKTFILNKETVHLNQLIETLAEQHKLKSKKEIQIHTHISPENLTIEADRTHLNNIISNLIDNSIKYSKEEVNIDIDVHTKGRYCIIRITDDGIGISPDRINYIFDKFYRVSTGNQYNVKGYGLGLFYVKTMVEKHNGTVSVESTPGSGSAFTIQLPLS
ncbi:sensor histidine kinase [Dysgonomonas macrotermitis]|uniref:histidine kinase n=1 Tax=Dysgonomonas macrotermitis TaxID=1346286 RepID=A0A1M4TDS4_9BACT|nr:HAMP domain-containing sensor histidine kinase [Dysgonomonas macrotermitis]SHE42525.1 His Kinase A (phospho-acceptor) domain-containing protein [Dysgonomonas macrotermitis]